MRRPFGTFAVVCALVAVGCVTCYAGYAPDDAGRGESGSIIVALIFAVAAVFFWLRKDKPAS